MQVDTKKENRQQGKKVDKKILGLFVGKEKILALSLHPNLDL